MITFFLEGLSGLCPSYILGKSPRAKHAPWDNTPMATRCMWADSNPGWELCPPQTQTTTPPPLWLCDYIFFTYDPLFYICTYHMWPYVCKYKLRIITFVIILKEVLYIIIYVIHMINKNIYNYFIRLIQSSNKIKGLYQFIFVMKSIY